MYLWRILASARKWLVRLVDVQLPRSATVQAVQQCKWCCASCLHMRAFQAPQATGLDTVAVLWTFTCWVCALSPAVCSAVPHMQHVPLLPETVRRLLLPPYMATHVQYLKEDRSHGAAELAAYVLQVSWSSLRAKFLNLPTAGHNIA